VAAVIALLNCEPIPLSWVQFFRLANDGAVEVDPDDALVVEEPDDVAVEPALVAVLADVLV
jgi:hypothetical protein